MTTTMKAIVQQTYGSADMLELRDIDQPGAGAGEVLLRVHAAGISRGDVHLMTGEPYLLRAGFGIRRPKNRVPGQDVAATIVAIGPDVTRFSIGDDVFGIARGSFAEYAVGSSSSRSARRGRAYSGCRESSTADSAPMTRCRWRRSMWQTADIGPGRPRGG